MGTRRIVYTGTGHEPANTVIASAVLPAFTGTFTMSVSSPTTEPTHAVYFQFVRGSDASVCFQYDFGWFGGSGGPVGGTVGTGMSCTNWTLWAIKNQNFPAIFTAGATITFTLTGPNVPDDPPPTPCAYGTRPKSDTALVLPITGAIVDLVLDHFHTGWLGFLFSSIIGISMRMDTLCNTIPPTWPAIDVTALLNDNLARLVLFQALAWHVFCECVPGTPAPTPITEPTPVQPTGWPVYGPYPCTNSDICSTLQIILKRLDQLSTSQNISISNNTQINQGGSLLYRDGAVHSGLAGSGTLTVAGLIGVRLELTSGIPGHQLEGNPPYIWDVGWHSVSDGGAMLQEQRITRTSTEWFPAGMKLASVWGYFFKGGTIGRMTELLPIGS